MGQIFIVNFGGQFFNVVPLKLGDWILITAATSLVIWIDALYRRVVRNKVAKLASA